MPTPDQITIADVRAARERLSGVTVRTPLVRLDVPSAAGEIWLKLENLQPIGSFKLRGAANAMLLAGSERLAQGAYTASAGNMAQGVAWAARHFGVPCAVVSPVICIEYARRSFGTNNTSRRRLRPSSASLPVNNNS